MYSHRPHNVWILFHPPRHASVEVQLININKLLRFHIINQGNTSKKNYSAKILYI